MKVNISKILGHVIALSVITVTMISASDNDNKSNVYIDNLYQNMSTLQLQKEVERLSQRGNLPFSMGKELIRRWTKIS